MSSHLKTLAAGLAALTGAKSFVANPVLGNPGLNRRGLHLVRLRAAHWMMRVRQAWFAYGVPREQRKAFQHDGYLLLEDFLPAEQYQRLVREAEGARGEIRQCRQADTLTRRRVMAPENVAALPEMQALMRDKRFRRLMRYCSGHARQPIMHLERIHNGVLESHERDPQKSLHVDTFQPTMKFWLYLQDVTPAQGPFMFVPGSTRMSSARLSWERHMSLIARDHPNRYTQRGSFRVDEGDLERFGLGEVKHFAVKANTLLIANTYGMHGRGEAEQSSTRFALWGMSRTTPFSPLPGLGFEWINRLQYRVLEAERQRDDRKAAARGEKASWFVPSDNGDL
ncbi:phytanoyl-CoA dioxygenase family protein [Cobetia sp. Ld8]|uniref:phytanoyl-CoA dioxygenase family protein n=1 Tax=Cobetia sp. Ld8 TaxID=649154 RepID=UPI003864014C